MTANEIPYEDFAAMDAELASIKWDVAKDPSNQQLNFEEIQDKAFTQEAMKSTSSFVFNGVGASIAAFTMCILSGKPIDIGGDYRL